MQQAKHVKYNFDTVFGAKGAQAQVAARARSSYSSEEVDAIKQEVFAQGKNDAEAKAGAARAQALSALAQTMMRVLNQLDETIVAHRQESVTVALQVARKLAGAAIDAFPLQEVEALLADCLHKLHREPRLVVRVASQSAEELRGDIDAMCAQHGFTGRVVVLAEQSLTGADCRIEWADGGIEHDLGATFAAIEQAAAHWRASLTNKEG